MMSPEREKEIIAAIRLVVEEQSEGEWDDSTVDSDTNMFFNQLWEYFSDDS